MTSVRGAKWETANEKFAIAEVKSRAGLPRLFAGPGVKPVIAHSTIDWEDMALFWPLGLLIRSQMGKLAF